MRKTMLDPVLGVAFPAMGAGEEKQFGTPPATLSTRKEFPGKPAQAGCGVKWKIDVRSEVSTLPTFVFLKRVGWRLRA
jgi:hypothetical protein